jgi:ketosteroid isomerase-like protein
VSRQDVVERYVAGFRAGDHAAILGCLTEDVTWEIVGHATAAGRAEFEALIDGPPGASLPRLTVERHVEQGDLVVTFGAGEFDTADGVRHTFRFADSFAFRGELISAVVSYVVPT